MALSGPEIMLRSMGFGEILDAAKKMASAETVQKIIAFADGLEELNARLARIEAKLGIERQGVIEGTVVRGPAQPDPGSAAGGPGGPAGSDDLGIPDDERAHRRA